MRARTGVRGRLAALVAARLMAIVAVALPGVAWSQDLPAPAPPAQGAVLATGSEAASRAVSEPLWELGLGAAVVRFPDYRGSDEAKSYVLPLPFVAYRGRFLRADRDGARAIFFAGHRIEADVSMSAATPTESKDNAARRGMPDLPGSVEFGPNLNVELWQSRDRHFKLDARFPLRQVFTLERSPHSVGVTFAPNLNLDIRNFAGRWNIGLLAGPVFDSRRYHQHYYGVAPEFATADRPAYRASGGYAGWRGTVAFSRRLGNAWLGGFFRYDDLSGATFRTSPLVRAERSWQAGFGVSWIFAVSQQRVVLED